MSKKLRPIVLAGGIGKRLWPLSTESRPKQFIPIFKELSLFDLTLQRINNSLFKKPIIVTSKRYLKQIQGSFERTGLKPSLIVLEPESKNTFPPIIAASILSNKELKNVLPCHLIITLQIIRTSIEHVKKLLKPIKKIYSCLGLSLNTHLKSMAI